jgi:hypothetical protein
MRLLDKFESLAGFGKFPTVILGNPSTRDFELIDLERVPLEPHAAADIKSRGLFFCGTFAVIDDQFRCELAVSLNAEVLESLSATYASLVVAKGNELKHAISGASWLEKLWSLVDPRETN